LRSYQETHFDEIADAIRYVDGTTPPIVALDFADRIRALKSLTGGGSLNENCHLSDNIPDGCGGVHGLLHLDFTLVNCVTERLRDPKTAGNHVCLCDDNWAYGPPACDNLHGLLHLDFSLVDCSMLYSVLWGYNNAGN